MRKHRFDPLRSPHRPGLVAAPASPRRSSGRACASRRGPRSDRHPRHPEGQRRGPHRAPSAAPCRRRSKAPISSRSRSSPASRCGLSRLRSDQGQGHGRDRQRRMGHGAAQPRLDHEPAEARRLLREDRLRTSIDDGVDPAYRFEYGLEMLVWAQVLAYRTDAFEGRSARRAGPTSGTPRSFPAIAPWSAPAPAAGPSSSSRLMAAGVPADKLYPLDIDKALRRATTRSRRT